VYESHPIQLKKISIRHLSAEITNESKSHSYDGEINLAIEHGISEFDEDQSIISVGLRVEVTPDESKYFCINVEIIGHFLVDTKKFRKDQLGAWSKMNAPFLLLPYVREQVYGLSNRIGLKNMILPLFIQPQFKDKPASD
jgi:preprotein translocase subunit SecB